MNETPDGSACGADGRAAAIAPAAPAAPDLPAAPVAAGANVAGRGERTALQLAIVSDAICPWCYIGKRHLDRALETLREEFSVSVHWKPFELNPDTPKAGLNRREYRIAKFGSWEEAQRRDAHIAAAGQQAGLAFRHDLMQRTPNTFDAHRLVWLAEREGVQDAMVEELFAGYFTRGLDIGSTAVLADIGAAAGLERAMVEGFLAGDEAADEVREAESFGYGMGISGVPTVTLNGRPLFSGAVGAEAMIARIRAAARGAQQDRRP
jgi:predicted DsbA family dithiol-disulfide isomerase